jgi:O-antigen/teichoic acid export membrane protein
MEQRKENLTSQTLRGMKWTLLATVVNVSLQIGYTSIMARLLPPEVFGLVALGLVFIRFALYFSHLGMSRAIVQKQDISKEEIRAAFTYNLLMSSFFLLFFQLAAPYAVFFLKNEQVVLVVRVMAFGFFVEGLASVSMSLLRKEMRFKQLAQFNILSYFLAYIVIGILLAYLDWGVWALMIATLSQTVFNGILAYLLVRHSVIPIFGWKYYKELFGYSSKISVVGILEYIGHSIDTFAVGKFFGDSALGLYNRATFLITLPATYLTDSFAKVLFPSLSKIQKETEKLKGVYLTAILIVGFLVFPLSIGVSIAAEPIVQVLLGDSWIGSIVILQVYALSTPFRFISHFGGVFCDAIAALNIKLILKGSYICLMCLMFYVLRSWGIAGFTMGIVIAEVYLNFAYMFALRKRLGYTWVDLWQAYQPGLVSGIWVGLWIYGAMYLLKYLQLPMIFLLFGAILAGALGLFSAFFLAPNIAIRLEISQRLEKSLGNRNNPRLNKLFSLLKK